MKTFSGTPCFSRIASGFDLSAWARRLAGTAVLSLLVSFQAMADGTEELGPPVDALGNDIAIAVGTGIVSAGAGLSDEEPLATRGVINITVPGTVKQVLLYWEGQDSGVGSPMGFGDSTALVNGTEVTGTLIGGQTNFFHNAWSTAFRADITAEAIANSWIVSGANTLTITGIDYTKIANGAGVMVVYDEGSDPSEIQIRDGLDLAFFDFVPPLDTTVRQDFTFAPSSSDRTALLDLFFSSVTGTVSGAGKLRPESLEVTVAGVTTVFTNNLFSADGEEWDTVNFTVDIPAGADSLSVQAFSRDDNISQCEAIFQPPEGTNLDGIEYNRRNLPVAADPLPEECIADPDQVQCVLCPKPASFAWTAVGLSIPPDEPPLAALGDRVWLDNGNDIGIQECTDDGAGGNGILGDGDDSGAECLAAGVNGVLVELYAVDVNEAVCGEDGTTFVTYTTTANGGFYLFEDLVPGAYCVVFTKPAGLECTDANVNGNDAIDSDGVINADGLTCRTDTTVLSPGETNRDVDLGLVEVIETAALGDRVWNDLNADGIQDCTSDDGDDIIGEPDEDTCSEPGIPDVTVRLYTYESGVCNTGNLVGQTMTDIDGFYLFEELPAGDSVGNYCVEFDQADANRELSCNPIIGVATLSPQGEGADPALDSDADPANGRTGLITLDPGDVDLTWDAGFYCPAKIGDRLTDDTYNRNGIQDDPEPAGVSGQTVDLLKCEGDVPGTVAFRTTTTASDGMYMFNPLPPGRYAVRFTAPGGTVFSPKDQGGNDAVDCDADNNGWTECVTLAPNEYNPTVDACVNKPPSAGLGDFVWEDKNANGEQDGGEPGIEGVPVTLYRPGDDGECGTGDEDFVASTNTEADGSYDFMKLVGGNYCVEFDKSAVSCEFGTGTASYSPQNSAADDKDSDVDPATNQTGLIDLPEDFFDPTWDAGIYCPAKLGDRVWEDLDPNGIQDFEPTVEPGVVGVTVNLLDCQGNPVEDLEGFSSKFTDGTGMYMFLVEPGKYIVEFESPADRIFTEQNAPLSAPDNDSDADKVSGRTVCITVPSNTYDDTWDAGLIPPPDCGIAVEKTCVIEQTPRPFTCDDKVDALAMTLAPGLGDVVSVTAHIGGTSEPTLPVTISGNEVSVSGYQTAGAPNDVVWLVQTTTGSYQSEFHLSCSDDEMDGETDNPAFLQDCGRPEGNGKDNSSGDNIWLLEGLTSDKGGVLDCTPSAPQVGTSECEFQQQIASCSSLPDKPSTLQFQYTGAGCGFEDNSQDDGKTGCSGSIDPGLPVTASFPGGTATVDPGQTFTIPREGSETTIDLSNAGGTESITLHTSCSQPLEAGDVFFSLTLAGLDGQGMGADVVYSYVVMNTGTASISDIMVVDDKLGLIADGLSLSPGASTTPPLTASAFISETTKNTATVSGTGIPGAECTATDTATVNVLPPPPCEVNSTFKELKDDAIKYKVQNTSSRVATLETLMLDFPSEYVTIKEVKLDGTIYKSSDSSLIVGPGVVIGADDWTEDNVGKRELDPGESRTLEIKFSKKAKGYDKNDFSGVVNFEQGCSTGL